MPFSAAGTGRPVRYGGVEVDEIRLSAAAEAAARPKPMQGGLGFNKTAGYVGVGIAERLLDGQLELAIGGGVSRADTARVIEMMKGRADREPALEDDDGISPAAGLSLIYRFGTDTRAFGREGTPLARPPE